MLSARDKTPRRRKLLKIMYRCYFAKIYVTLGVQLQMKYHGTKYQTSGPLKLDESRFILKGMNKFGAKHPPREDVFRKTK